MNKVSRYLWLAGCVAALLTTGAWADVVMTMKVVDINGSPPSGDNTPNEIFITDEGDVFTIELYLEDWEPYGGLAAYGFGFLPAGFYSGDAGAIKLASHECTKLCSDTGGTCYLNTDCPSGETCDGDCVAGSLTSMCMNGTCPDGRRCHVGEPDGCEGGAECVEDGLFCDCYASLYIDKDRWDYVFADPASSVSTNCRAWEAVQGAYRGIGALAVPVPGAPDPGDPPRYLGMIVLTALEGACGDFTISLDPDSRFTIAMDQFQSPMPLDSSSTVIVHVDCCMPVASDPEHCAIDARQPHGLNDTTAVGWGKPDPIEIEYNKDVSALGTFDFQVTQTPSGSAPMINQVLHPDDYTVRLVLNKPINPGCVTCFTIRNHPECTGKGVCVGYLPGDVDAPDTCPAAEEVVDAADIGALIDHINGTAPRPDRAVDIDRDGDVGPQDIIRLLDLLNGADAFDPWLGETLPYEDFQL